MRMWVPIRARHYRMVWGRGRMGIAVCPAGSALPVPSWHGWFGPAPSVLARLDRAIWCDTMSEWIERLGPDRGPEHPRVGSLTRTFCVLLFVPVFLCVPFFLTWPTRVRKV